MAWLWALGSVISVSIVSLIGLFFVSFDRTRLDRMLLILVSFAIGALTGDAFIHLIPEAFEELGSGLTTSLFILLGVLLFFSVERFVRWRHCHIPTSDSHVHPVATLNLIGEGVHNFIDGVLIGATYLVSIPLGLTTTLAVLLHEIPQEVGDFGILVNAGYPVKKALIYNFTAALTSVLGAVLALSVGPLAQSFSLIMIPITAGGFIYIAGADLVPQVQEECGSAGITLSHFVAIVLGIGLMAALVLLE